MGNMEKLKLLIGLLLIIILHFVNVDKELSIKENNGEKRCWIVEGKTSEFQNIFTEETMNDLRQLRKKIERELEPWGEYYGKISEIEFEFENDREVAFHVVGAETKVE